jgi:hypothetical protein
MVQIILDIREKEVEVRPSAVLTHNMYQWCTLVNNATGIVTGRHGDYWVRKKDCNS